MSKLGAARLLMILTIVLIMFVQGDWLLKVYREEEANLQKSADILFRECMYKLQADRFKNDTLIYHGLPNDNLFIMDVVNDLEKKLPTADGTDSIPIKRIDSAYRISLNKAGIEISFQVFKDSLMRI